MIVDNSSMDAAVEFLADDETAAMIQYKATQAANHAKAVFARLYLSFNSGPVAEREARATCADEYAAAKEREALAEAKLFAHKQRQKWAETVREIWRSEYSRETHTGKIG